MYKFTITGVVQGVGFRPHIFNACIEEGLCGYVKNIGDGVVVVVDKKEIFENILHHLPSSMRIDSVSVVETKESYDGFSIKDSDEGGFAEIPPDQYLCDACIEELNDPSNRRSGYFFITCTKCGPRFTITLGSPFDREMTTMRDFHMCAACREEYMNPKDRRYHAQTIACPDCGPQLSLLRNKEKIECASDEEKLRVVAEAISSGEIVAIKGVGGFHLACKAEKNTVAKLNILTKRINKPYALMCKDMDMVERIAVVTPKERDLLFSSARPIVLLKKRSAPECNAASELDTVGVMLAYSGLHVLLFRHYDAPLVMTSSNYSDEPITTKSEEQPVSLVLDHSRRIEHHADDSVVKVINETHLFVRRSRGYVPRSIAIEAGETKNILALGAEMNSTFALYHNNRVTLSTHMGNTANISSFENYKRNLREFLRLMNIQPEIIVCDKHDGYNTSHYANELAQKIHVPVVRVQHHRAHVYAVAAEHGLSDFVGIAADGLGYGDDGAIWGGEIINNGERIGHLEEQRQLGGDRATRFPAHMLFAILRKFMSLSGVKRFVGQFSDTEVDILDKQLHEGFNAPRSSSCGRILDAASVLLGFCAERTYDGRPAMLLEAHSSTPYDIDPVIKENVLLTTPLFEYLIRNIHKDHSRLAATVEMYLAKGLYAIAAKEKKPIVWAGGCAYNRIMTAYMLEHGVLINKEVPAGDGGISFGQIAAVLANARNNIS